MPQGLLSSASSNRFSQNLDSDSQERIESMIPDLDSMSMNNEEEVLGMPQMDSGGMSNGGSLGYGASLRRSGAGDDEPDYSKMSEREDNEIVYRL